MRVSGTDADEMSDVLAVAGITGEGCVSDFFEAVCIATILLYGYKEDWSAFLCHEPWSGIINACAGLSSPHIFK